MGKFVSGPTIYRGIEFVTESQVLGRGARAWHTTMSAFLEIEVCKTVVFEKSMWRVVIDGHQILLDAHMDDLVIACANQPVLDAFRKLPLIIQNVFWYGYERGEYRSPYVFMYPKSLRHYTPLFQNAKSLFQHVNSPGDTPSCFATLGCTYAFWASAHGTRAFGYLAILHSYRICRRRKVRETPGAQVHFVYNLSWCAARTRSVPYVYMCIFMYIYIYTYIHIYAS